MLFARKPFRLDRYVRVPAILFFRNLGLGMALLLTMSACGASIQGSISNPTATPSAPIRHELANPTDTALARTVLLRPSELPAGWTPVGQEDDTAADLTNNRFCVSDYPAYVAGSFIACSFRLDPKTNYEQGHLAAWIRMTDSDADAQRQLDLLSSPKADVVRLGRCDRLGRSRKERPPAEPAVLRILVPSFRPFPYRRPAPWAASRASRASPAFRPWTPAASGWASA